MGRTFISRMKTEHKVYAILVLLFVALLVWAVIETGWLKPKTFDEEIFEPAICLDQKRAFNHSQQPRKKPEDVEDVNDLIVVRFNNMGRGNGNYGVIDVDGSVVVEPVFENYLQVYDGILRTTDENNQPLFYDLNLNELPVKEASKPFYDQKQLARLYRNVNMNPAFTLKSKSTLASEFVKLIEEQAKLELFYLNFYKEPEPFYSMRMLSSIHERVYVVMDENVQLITPEYFVNQVYFELNGIAKVERICSIAYMNMDGEFIWYEDDVE